MRLFKNVLFMLLFSFAFSTSSCYTYEFSVGQGAQTGVEVKEKNHYFIYGLAPGKTSEPAKMADGADSYSVKVYHSFVDGLINSLTFGIYNPTTTIVTK
ncbi:MAG: Bor family protein [Saprospiraceae bacterium]